MEVLRASRYLKKATDRLNHDTRWEKLITERHLYKGQGEFDWSEEGGVFQTRARTAPTQPQARYTT